MIEQEAYACAEKIHLLALSTKAWQKHDYHLRQWQLGWAAQTDRGKISSKNIWVLSAFSQTMWTNAYGAFLSYSTSICSVKDAFL